MKSKVSALLAFAAGAAVGSFITWRCVKNYYEQIAEDEINSVREVFQKREKEPVRSRSKVEMDEYGEKLQECGYSESKDDSLEKRPYVISPSEFGDIDEYAKISLTYYSNNVLADENDEIVEDVDETVGIDSLTHFGEYEDDSVFVRNDARRCDYEILLDQRSYTEIAKRMPHGVGA